METAKYWHYLTYKHWLPITEGEFQRMIRLAKTHKSKFYLLMEFKNCCFHITTNYSQTFKQ